MTPDARRSLAGTWYPADPGRLAGAVDAFLDAAVAPGPAGRLLALVAPHAGHQYSGAIAGAAFALARHRHVDVVAVVGPMHRPCTGTVLTSAHAAYATPLGLVAVDGPAQHALADALSATGVRLVGIRDDDEHSVEVELPFLQRALAPAFTLLPVMVRDDRPAVLRALGRGLAGIARARPALLVASTDLSHYYPESTARVLDAGMLRCVEALDADAVLAADAAGVAQACGAGALAAVLWAAASLGADRAQTVRYGTSADVTGDRDQVVGYAAVAVTGQPAR